MAPADRQLAGYAAEALAEELREWTWEAAQGLVEDRLPGVSSHLMDGLVDDVHLAIGRLGAKSRVWDENCGWTLTPAAERAARHALALAWRDHCQRDGAVYVAPSTTADALAPEARARSSCSGRRRPGARRTASAHAPPGDSEGPGERPGAGTRHHDVEQSRRAVIA